MKRIVWWAVFPFAMAVALLGMFAEWSCDHLENLKEWSDR